MKSGKQKALSCKLSNRVAAREGRLISEAYRLPLKAFTLLEVVVAIGIFAVGMVAVIGLFSPVAKSVGDSADAEAATRVADLLTVKLQTLGIDAVAPKLKVKTGTAAHELTTADATVNYDVTKDPKLLFASRDGTKIGFYNETATWPNGDRDKFFEIALIRNEAISPLSSDPTGDALLPVLAYTVRVRWPAFVPLAGSTGAVQPAQAAAAATVPFDHSQKQVLFFSGAVTR